MALVQQQVSKLLGRSLRAGACLTTTEVPHEYTGVGVAATPTLVVS